jgi:hypothetical protein
MQFPNAQRSVNLRPRAHRLAKRLFGTNAATRLDERVSILQKGPRTVQVPAANRLDELGHGNVRRALRLAWRIVAVETTLGLDGCLLPAQGLLKFLHYSSHVP